MNKLWNKLKRWFIEMGSPPLFYNWSSKIIPWLGLLTLLVLLIGLYWGLFVAPMDYKHCLLNTSKSKRDKNQSPIQTSA